MYEESVRLYDSFIGLFLQPNNEVQRDLEMSQRSEDPHTVYSSENLVPVRIHLVFIKKKCTQNL